MNVIRCDEQEYMLWKWPPEGQAVNSISRENSKRYRKIIDSQYYY